jgi:hypothetical protein
MAKAKDKPLYVQVAERDDFSDLLRLIPSWVWGAVIWYAFTKIVLDSLSPKKPGTEINLAIIAGDFLPDWISDGPADLPPGVKLAAFVDVALGALDVWTAFWKLKPPGVQPAETLVQLGAGPLYAFTEWLENITGVSK